MIIHDSFSNQFMLYNYISNLNCNLIQFIENNNININYYCFYKEVNNSTHNIITSSTTKRKDSCNKSITIKTFTDFFDTNSVNEQEKNLIIKFENIYIQIEPYTQNLNIEIRTYYNENPSEKKIYCEKYYNANILENNVTEIINVYDQNILCNLENLSTVVFHDRFNQKICNSILPKSIINLTFGYRYNQYMVENTLPKSLHTLTFGKYYNQIINVNVLPKMLQTLVFGSMFDKNIELEVLPTSLRILTFGRWWNNILQKNVLPHSLEILTLSKYYNQTISANVLPQSIKKIQLDCNKQGRPYAMDSVIPTEFKSKVVCWNTFGTHYING
jgi:hypothetical protein